MRGKVEQPVQPLVHRRQRAGIAEGGRFAGDDLGHGGDLGLAGMLGREARGGALQHFAHHIELDHLLMVGACHRKPSSGFVGQQPLGLQPRDRLADRGAGHPEAGGEIDLGQPFARRQAAIADRRADAGIGALGKVAGGGGTIHADCLACPGQLWIHLYTSVRTSGAA